MELISHDSNTLKSGFHQACGYDDNFLQLTAAPNLELSYEKRVSFHNIDGKNQIVFSKNLRDNFEVITGIIDPEKIYKEKNDFIFCTIMNPIDKIYENYCYAWLIMNVKGFHEVPEKDVELYKDSIIKYAGGTSLEHYINFYIEYKGDLPLNDNVMWCRSTAIQTIKVDGNCDFVGILDTAENVWKTTQILNSKLNINLQFIDMYNEYKKMNAYCNKHTYRRRDLERTFEKELYDFYALKQRFSS